ncbi:MAG: tRNA pseudouridine(55) synthase TruB [Candidatus Nanopelagicaceae bacterium]
MPISNQSHVNNGFLVIDKPGGVTSHDVVAKARKDLNTRKIGHSGTLDPMATGVLVLGVGDGTRLLQYITAGVKKYEATVKLGILTSTDDKEGEVIGTTEIPVDIPAAFARQSGKIMQKPSKVSAIRIDGKRAYDLVREGVEVDIPPREVEIYELKINAIHGDEVEISVTCSAGTYIRAIARDCGGHLTSLRRTQVGIFDLTMAGKLLDIAEVAAKLFTPRKLTEAEVAQLRFGRSLEATGTPGIVAAIAPDGTLAALLENKEGSAKPFTVFVK